MPDAQHSDTISFPAVFVPFTLFLPSLPGLLVCRLIVGSRRSCLPSASAGCPSSRSSPPPHTPRHAREVTNNPPPARACCSTCECVRARAVDGPGRARDNRPTDRPRPAHAADQRAEHTRARHDVVRLSRRSRTGWWSRGWWWSRRCVESVGDVSTESVEDPLECVARGGRPCQHGQLRTASNGTRSKQPTIPRCICATDGRTCDGAGTDGGGCFVRATGSTGRRHRAHGQPGSQGQVTATTHRQRRRTGTTGRAGDHEQHNAATDERRLCRGRAWFGHRAAVDHARFSLFATGHLHCSASTHRRRWCTRLQCYC